MSAHLFKQLVMIGILLLHFILQHDFSPLNQLCYQCCSVKKQEQSRRLKSVQSIAVHPVTNWFPLFRRIRYSAKKEVITLHLVLHHLLVLFVRKKAAMKVPRPKSQKPLGLIQTYVVRGVFSGSNTLMLSMDSGQKFKDINSSPLPPPAFLVG